MDIAEKPAVAGLAGLAAISRDIVILDGSGIMELLGFCERSELDLLVTCPHAGIPICQVSTHPRRLANVFGAEKGGCSQTLAWR